jgi:hypothetical protein
MPFDPNVPADHAELTGVMFRGQFNGLKEFIDLLNAQQITGAAIDSVSTGNPGDPASVGVNLVNGVLRFSFVLPRGDTGAAGQEGQPGQNGQDGQPGPQGPPFANAIVDAVTTLNPGDNATVGTSFDGTNVRFTFGIPRGNDGAQGSQGPPGEVTHNDLNNAITGTSSNSNGVSLLGFTVSDPPSQSEMQAVVDKIDELITVLRRP